MVTEHLRRRRSGDSQERQSAAQSEVISVTFLAGILAVYVYFTGWMFAYYYFGHFGISLNALDIPLQHYYVYAYTVFVAPWGVGVLAAVVTISYALAITGWGRWAAVPLLLLFFYVCVLLAWQEAEKQVLAVRRDSDVKPVYLTFKSNTHSLPKEFAEQNLKGSLRLLAESKNEYFVLRQPRPDDGDPEWPAAEVFRVRGDDVLLSMVRLGGFPAVPPTMEKK